MNIAGTQGVANFPGFSERELTAVKAFFGVNKDDLEDVQKEFEDAGVEAPAGIVKLSEAFKDFDLNKDDVLSVAELVGYNKEGELGLENGAMSLIGVGEGTSQKQLEIMAKLARGEQSRNESLEYLADKFSRYDKDNDGLINSEELEKYAKRQDLTLADSGDKKSLENALTARVISAYELNQESSTGFLASLFVAEA